MATAASCAGFEQAVDLLGRSQAKPSKAPASKTALLNAESAIPLVQAWETLCQAFKHGRRDMIQQRRLLLGSLPLPGLSHLHSAITLHSLRPGMPLSYPAHLGTYLSLSAIWGRLVLQLQHWQGGVGFPAGAAWQHVCGTQHLCCGCSTGSRVPLDQPAYF